MPTMKHAGVIGHPLEHSLSPVIFGAAFKAAGIKADYEAWKTTADQLEGRINALRGDDMLGANVTIPHKEAVVPLLDRLDERAELVGAVNTIVNENGDLVGYNTDVAGFDRALREDGGLDPSRKRTVILGAGGAARAVATALVQGNASVVLLTGRSPRKLEGICAALRARTAPGVTVSWCYSHDGTYMTVIPQADLLVNCTPVGTRGGDNEDESPIDPADMPSGGLVFDLIYDPTETPLLAAAKKNGSKTLGGLAMLVYQAAESFRLWTSEDAPVERMLKAGRSALQES